MASATTTDGPIGSAQQSPMASTVSIEYAELLQKLLTINVNRKVRMGVENTAKLQELLGDAYTDDSFRVLHVGGTNGG